MNYFSQEKTLAMFTESNLDALCRGALAKHSESFLETPWIDPGYNLDRSGYIF
jgi:hypothetical protein